MSENVDNLFIEHLRGLRTTDYGLRATGGAGSYREHVARSRRPARQLGGQHSRWPARQRA